MIFDNDCFFLERDTHGTHTTPTSTLSCVLRTPLQQPQKEPKGKSPLKDKMSLSTKKLRPTSEKRVMAQKKKTPIVEMGKVLHTTSKSHVPTHSSTPIISNADPTTAAVENVDPMSDAYTVSHQTTMRWSLLDATIKRLRVISCVLSQTNYNSHSILYIKK